MTSVVATNKDTGPIRNPIDVDALNEFLGSPLTSPNVHTGPGVSWPIVQVPVTVEQFKYGQSNPTYLLTDRKGKGIILRRKPSPNSKLLSGKAHNIEREFWITFDVQKLNLEKGFQVPIAKPQVLCENESILGTVFYLSEFVDGFIFHDPGMPTLDEDRRRRCWESAVRAAIQIHQLPVSELRHSFPGTSGQKSKLRYFQRQVKALTNIEKVQSLQPKTPRIYRFDTISKYLMENLPEDPEKSLLIHGDFKIDNFIFDLDRCQVVAVLDWELATLGSPAFDLANLLQNFYFPALFNEAFLNITLGSDPIHVHKVLKHYVDTVRASATKDGGNLRNWVFKHGANQVEDAEGSDTIFRNWTYAKVFACYRLAVIMQGIHARVVTGTSSSGFANKYLGKYDVYAKLALELIGNSSPKL